MAQTEVSMGDAELDALMAELDVETADMVAKPILSAVVIAVPELESKPIPELIAAIPSPVPVIIPPDAPVEPARVDKEAAIPEALVAPVVLTTVPVAVVVAEAAVAASPRSAAALQFYIDTNDFAKDIAISDTTLDACMMNQASLRAHYGFAHARSEAQSSRTDLSVDVAVAQLYDKHRKEFALDPTIKVTEKMVESAVQQDPKYRQLKNRAIEAKEIASINKAAVEAIKDRRDMIIQAGADRRDEYKGQARVMTQTDERSALTARAMAAVQK